MVTLAVRRVVLVCIIALAPACARKSAAPAVNSEPVAPMERGNAALAADAPGAAAPRAFDETESAGGEYAEEAWPDAQNPAAHQKSAGSAKYDNDAPRPAPERRPGLATQYGERRDSSITQVHFDRDDDDRPSAMLSLFYDDESGVESKTGRDADDATPGIFPVRGVPWK